MQTQIAPTLMVHTVADAALGLGEMENIAKVWYTVAQPASIIGGANVHIFVFTNLKNN